MEDLGEKTVTVDGKTFTQEEFMLKYQGDNITYGYLVDKSQIIIAKYDKRYNFFCELVIETVFESAPKSLSTKVITAYRNDIPTFIKKFVKEKLLEDESE